MPETTLLVAATLALGSALGFMAVGALVATRSTRQDTMAAFAFPAFWFFAGAVYATQGMRPLVAYFGLDSWPLIVSLEQLSTPFYCLAGSALCFYVLYLLTGRSSLVVPVSLYFLAMAVALRYQVARAEPIGYVVTEWQVNYVYATGLQSLGYSITLALTTAPLFAAIVGYSVLGWRLEDPIIRWRVAWVGAGLVLWIGMEAFTFATGLAATPTGEVLRRSAGLATALVVAVGYARHPAPARPARATAP